MSLFDGMTRDQLAAALASAQLALIDLQSGKAFSSLSYTQGDGSKSVSRRVTSIGDATALILQLQAALGIGRRRRAIRMIYS